MLSEKPIGVVALDLDGTIMPADEIIDMGVLERLSTLRQRGIKLILVTGRCIFDLEMFRVCHLRVAVRNAVEMLKEQADYVTKEDDGKGVSEAIDKFLLIAHAS